MKRFRKAILIIHGFTGNLYDNEYLMNYLELDNEYDVYARTLPGHNKDRFTGSNCEEWKKSAEMQVEELINNGYQKIYVVGHSMGGILATYVAGKYKEIKKIVLINAAFDYANVKLKKEDSKNSEFSKFGRLWEKVLRTSPIIFYEFTKMVKESKNYLSGVRCDTLILRSTKDEIIPYNVGDVIYNKINTNNKWLTDVIDAPHTVLSSNRKEDVSEYIKLFLKGGRKWKKSIKKEI